MNPIKAFFVQVAVNVGFFMLLACLSEAVFDRILFVALAVGNVFLALRAWRKR